MCLDDEHLDVASRQAPHSPSTLHNCEELFAARGRA